MGRGQVSGAVQMMESKREEGRKGLKEGSAIKHLPAT